MYKDKFNSPLKRELNAPLREKFIELGKSFKTLNTTRWIFIIFTILFAFKSYLQKIFMGPILIWFTNINPGDGSSYSSVPVSLLIFGFIFLSIPRLISNINFIIQLNQTSKQINDRQFSEAFWYQKIRLLLYAFLVFIFILIAKRVLTQLDAYYRMINVFADLNRIFYDISHYPEIFGIDLIIIVLGIMLVISSLAEKRVNYLSWNAFKKWILLQIEQVENGYSSKILRQMDLGCYLMKLGIGVMLVENVVGNIIFNIGLKKLADGFNLYSFKEIYIIPKYQMKNTLKVGYQPTQFLYQSIPSHLSSGQATVQYPQIGVDTTPKTQVNEKYNPIYCTYCGNKLISSNAKFCTNCGNRVQ
ncbi:zinc ribbon domain-containing protein [Candidatus Harpocratesius sp.]